MSKHTPGPWKIREQAGCLVVYASISAGESSVCELRYLWTPQQKANARLIASAPELLEALRQCITEEGATCLVHEGAKGLRFRKMRLDAISEIARAAIAKAEGGVE